MRGLINDLRLTALATRPIDTDDYTERLSMSELLHPGSSPVVISPSESQSESLDISELVLIPYPSYSAPFYYQK